MRTKSEIDKEYQQIAMLFGDRVHKHKLLTKEMEALEARMNALTQEPALLSQDLPPVPVEESAKESA